MKQNSVPKYIDPDDFVCLSGGARFPCSTSLMAYDVLTKRYFLTTEALEANRIEWGDDLPSSEVISQITEDIYGAILDIAPFNFRFMCYLIAVSKSLHFDQYTARKQFEKALIHQARYRMDNVDIRDINGVDIENNTNIYHKVLRKEHRHLSPKSLQILKGLGLLFNGDVPQRNLINYSEVM